MHGMKIKLPSNASVWPFDITADISSNIEWIHLVNVYDRKENLTPDFIVVVTTSLALFFIYLLVRRCLMFKVNLFVTV